MIKKEKILYFLIILVLVLVHTVPLISIRLSDASYLQPFSADEIIFYKHINLLINDILSFNIHEVLSFSTKATYGYPFWFLYAFLSIPITIIPDSFSSTLISFRVISMLFLSGTIFLIFLINYKLTESKIISFVFALILLLMPSFYGSHKFFSAEFMGLFFVVLSTYFLLIDKLDLKRNFYLAIVSVLVASSIKLNALTFGFIFILYMGFASYKNNFKVPILYILLKSIIIAIITLFICNINLFFDNNLYLYLEQIKYQLESNATGHFGAFDIYPIKKQINLWLFQGDQSITNTFFNIYILIFTVISYFIAIFIFYKKHYYIKSIMIFLYLTIYMGGSLYIILTIPKIWNWYLNFYFTFSMIGVVVLVSLIKNKYMKVFVAILFFILLFIVNIKINQSFYTKKLLESGVTDIDFRNKMSAKFKLYDLIKEISQKNNNKICIAYPSYYMFEDKYIYSLNKNILLYEYNYKKPESLDINRYNIIIFNGRSNKSHSLKVIQKLLDRDKYYKIFMFHSTIVLIKDVLNLEKQNINLDINYKIEYKDFNIFGEKEFKGESILLNKESILVFYLDIKKNTFYDMLINTNAFDNKHDSLKISINGGKNKIVHLKHSKNMRIQKIPLESKLKIGINLIELKYREPVNINSVMIQARNPIKNRKNK